MRVLKMLNKKTCKELAVICRMLAKATKDKKFEEPKVIRMRCHTCGGMRTIRRKYKKHIDYSKLFLERADIFEKFARRET